TGATGSTGPTGPAIILQPFVGANINPQSIPPGGNVTYASVTNANISYNGIDTFTINTNGIYVFLASLNFAPGQRINSTIGFFANNAIRFGDIGNADTVGNVVITSIGSFAAGNTIQIRNLNTDVPIDIINGQANPSLTLTRTSGQLIIFKFADGPLP
ncbi:hypothetical protein IKC_06635, partial [Bacillus cereus VD184]